MASSMPRPKRAGEDYARTHHQDEADDGPSKKPRFDLRNPSTLAPDAIDDDAVLDADEIGRRGQQVRRKAVNLDGYESDSDNEGFDARTSKKAKQEEAKQEADDDDMFAELQEDFGEEEVDGDTALHKNKKNVRFLRDDEIEGQVASSKSGRTLRVDLSQGGDQVNIDEDDSESDIAEEDRAKVETGIDEELGAGSNKKHAPLLDAFNMRTEQEEGRFDEQGNYVRKAADPDAVHDSWLEGVSKKDIRLAKEAADKRETERKEKDRATDSILTSDALKSLIMQLQRGETALDALARIGKGAPKKPKWRTKKNKKKGDEYTDMAEDDPRETARKQAIETVTEAADILMARGQPEIYDTEREILTRQYRRETGEDWVDPPQDGDAVTGDDGPAMWEYRWYDARDGGDIHGPYDGPTMESWKGAGYFGEGVEFKKVGDTGDWNSNVNFV
ncbi:hypothetical protein BDV19DRAFT_45238 [Aspergillus venezuelensis]